MNCIWGGVYNQKNFIKRGHLILGILGELRFGGSGGRVGLSVAGNKYNAACVWVNSD